MGILESEVYPKNPRSLCTVSLHVKPWTKYRPDIYINDTTYWICYPWEIWEVGRDLYDELSKNIT